jgi:hypothetical protein
MNGTHKVLVCADVNLMDVNINIMKKNKDVLLDATKEAGLQVNAEKLSTCSYLVTRLVAKVIR